MNRMESGSSFPSRPERFPIRTPLGSVNGNVQRSVADSSAAPFFIVGSGRSGTTLLRMALASHSRLSIPPETWYLLRLLEKFSPSEPLGAAGLNTAVKIMTEHYRWPDMQIDPGEFKREAEGLRKPRLRDVVELVYRKHLLRDGKARWGDKTPGYIKIVPQLSAMFADAKFIHFYRDGRDVARSFQAQGWYGPLLHESAREWNEAIDYNHRWRRSELAHRILQVRYEDFVLDTEKVLRDICNFLGEQFEPQMLAWQDRVDDLVPAREAPIHAKLKHTPSADDVFRWKREMSTREVFVLEAFMGKRLEGLGYERRFKGLLWPIPLMATRLFCRFVLPAPRFPLRVARAVHEKLRGRQNRSARANRR